jgi:hypothetical protein
MTPLFRSPCEVILIILLAIFGAGILLIVLTGDGRSGSGVDTTSGGLGGCGHAGGCDSGHGGGCF